MKNKMVKLNNNVNIPILGFGTYKMEDGKEAINAVSNALEIGYRHIDTASLYKNEKSVGEAIRNSGIKRSDIFVTTKVWNDDRGYDNTLKAFDTSLKKLNMDYIDLYLIHWPKDLNLETWKALERLYEEKIVRAIGVSNFKEHHLEELLKDSNIVPAINQVEFHPQLTQPELRKYCNSKGIVLEAWSPLMRGKVFSIDLLNKISKIYNKTISQIVLRWNIQLGVVTIPKSSKRERIEENFNIFDFVLSEEHMNEINSLNEDLRVGRDPDNIDF